MIKIYKSISILIAPIIFIFLLIRLLISKEKIQSIVEKFSFYKIKRPVGEIIWINGVSIGEAKTAITIAEEIKKKKPRVNILISTSTITCFMTHSRLRVTILCVVVNSQSTRAVLLLFDTNNSPFSSASSPCT